MQQMQLHPHSIKAINQGHPWIIKDKFTDAFPKDQLFLKGKGNGKTCCVFLNDPDHPKVKGRVWKTKNAHEWGTEDFLKDFEQRLLNALEKRSKIIDEEQRENLYLVFNESDLLPGLNILKLGKCCIFQYQSLFWTRERNWKFLCMEMIKARFETEIQFGEQTRGKKKTNGINGPLPRYWQVQEFGVHYQLDCLLYDFGIFTDMAGIRKQLYPFFKKKTVLNLYSYTGAFSLFALKAGAESVDSVDLSQKYLNILNDNLKLNPDLIGAHKTYCEPVDRYLKRGQNEKKSYDFIICDPPSSSTDGKKRTSALKEYPELIKKLARLLNAGGNCLIFLNTHQVTQKQFEEKIRTSVDRYFHIKKRLKLTGDCVTNGKFSEGNYLKGLLLELKN